MHGNLVAHLNSGGLSTLPAAKLPVHAGTAPSVRFLPDWEKVLKHCMGVRGRPLPECSPPGKMGLPTVRKKCVPKKQGAYKSFGRRGSHQYVIPCSSASCSYQEGVAAYEGYPAKKIEKLGHLPADYMITQGEEAMALKQQTMERIQRSGVVACLRMSCADGALAAARAALDGGITALEVTMDTPNAIQIIATLVREYPDATIGAGTVFSMEDAEAACGAGVRFMMSPVADEAIVRRFSQTSTLVIPGAMTPTEIMRANQWGARVLKVFPVKVLGGPDYIRALKRPLAKIPLIPANGVTLELVQPYILAGAMAVVLSDAIFNRDSIAAGDYDDIRRRAAMAAAIGAEASGASSPAISVPIALQKR